MSLSLLRCVSHNAKYRIIPAAVALQTKICSLSLLSSSFEVSHGTCWTVHNHNQGQIRSFRPSHTPGLAAEARSDNSVEDGEEFLSTQNPRWLQAGLIPEAIDLLNNKGIHTFTPVQGEAFESVVQGRDMICRSRTGTGKTLAFGLPSMTRLVDLTVLKGTRDARGKMKMGRPPSMVVLCPTRELARQVSDELSPFARLLNLNVAAFYGGVSYTPQMDALRNGIDILVGTPGRVVDHIESGNLDLSGCNIAVLDEADEMLNMGFSQAVEQILNRMGTANKTKTQTLMFSATTPDWVEKVGRQYQKDVVTIDTTGDTGGARVATTVKHVAVRVPPGEDLYSMLENIIRIQLANHVAAGAEARSNPSSLGKVIIFTNTKREADGLVMSGAFQTLSAASIHGDHSQTQRDTTLDGFRRGSFNVLVATDVAARGIDIKEVDLVVQIGPPNNTDTYVHRSGRTGRAGRTGVSLVVFNDNEKRDLVSIERELGHDFRFEINKAPSKEDLMVLATESTIKKLKDVPIDAVAQFQQTAQSMLAESSDPVELVARCLAAMSSRPTLATLYKPSSQPSAPSRQRGNDRPSWSSSNSHRSGGYKRNSNGRGSYSSNNNYQGGRPTTSRYNSNRVGSASSFDF